MGNRPFPPQVKGNPFLEYCWRKVHFSDSNIIFMITGLPGSGKSLLALNLMYLLDRDAKNHPRAELINIVFSAKSFVQAVRRNKKRGRVIIWEEPYAAGIKEGGANARQFMSLQNLKISTIFGTMRKNNHIIFLTMPFSSSFDFQARNVAHGTVQVMGNNGTASIAKFYLHEVNPVFKTTYNKYLRYHGNSRIKRMVTLKTGLAPRELVVAYKKKANFFKDSWAGEIEKAEWKPKGKKIIDTSVRDKIMLALQTRREEFTRQRKTANGVVDFLDFGKVGRTFGVGYGTAREYCRLAGLW